ncbi:MAG: hypothetical protein AUK31_01365 [Fibrobacteres bacterium CG2_30_45_31]|nr:MAG: hypothetical protein AUK31_01365 [Fibrobacteres bacterium CG2_30_45_31]
MKTMKNEKTETKNGVVPKLRFPEFRRCGEWDSDILGNKNVSHFVKDRVGLNELTLETYVSTENLLSDYSGVAISSKLPPSGSFTQYKNGDILVSNIRPYLKKIWQADRDGAASNDVIVIRSGKEVRSKFLRGLIQNDAFIDYVMKGAKGVKMPRGDISSMADYPVAFPSFEEQSRIADCLSSLDALIAAHSQKLDGLKSYKKGLMQQLFPAKGEKVPKLRFPEFRGSGEWEEKKLGEVAEINPGKHRVDESTKLSFVPMSAVSEDGQLVVSDIRKYSEVLKGYTYFCDNDVIVAKITPCYENGKSALAKNLKNGLAAGSTEFHVIRSNSKLLPSFLITLVNTDSVRILGKNSMAGTGGQQRVPSTFFELLTVFVPTLAEQQRIASFLSSIDNLITAQSQKIESLKTHKKGLMQQLFPAMGKANA